MVAARWAGSGAPPVKVLQAAHWLHGWSAWLALPWGIATTLPGSMPLWLTFCLPWAAGFWELEPRGVPRPLGLLWMVVPE